MRITITIPDDVAEALFAYAPGKTKTAAINHVLADWVRLKRIQELRSLRGNLDVADDLDRLRALTSDTQ